MLELLGIAELADKPVESLSLGQSRLVEAGRALMTGPQILLLDEPSSGTGPRRDAESGRHPAGRTGHQGVCVLLVEHDVALVADFTERTYVLDSGAIIAEGPTAGRAGRSRGQAGLPG